MTFRKISKRLLLLFILSLSYTGFSQFVPISVFMIKAPQGLNYANNYYFNKWYAITTVTPTMTNYAGGSPTLAYSIVPALPAGLSFSTTTGQITGTPTDYDPTGTSYTVTVSNQGGSSQDTFDIFIIPANHTWTGGAFPDTNWSTGANWLGMNPPTSINTATFDNYCSAFGSGCNATIDVSIDIEELQMKSDYTGTITQNAGQSIILGNNGRTNPGGHIQEAGTFNGSSGNIEMDIFQLLGGTYTATSGEMNIGYNAAHSDTEQSTIGFGSIFNHNNGTVIFQTNGNNSPYRKSHTLNLDQKWILYNLEFDINSSTVLGDGEKSAHYLEIRGLNKTFEVQNNLHFRDGYIKQGTIDFYGANVTFHCDSPTYDKCSDSNRDGIQGHDFSGILILNFLGIGAQSYTYDAGADSPATFWINNASGVTTASTGDFSIMGLKIDSGNFSAPANSDLHFLRDAQYHYRSNSGGFEINGTGTFTHNNSNIIISGESAYNDDRTAIKITDNVIFYDLTINVSGDSDGSSLGAEDTNVKLASGVDLLIENDLRVQNGSFNGSGSNNITIRGDYYRECSAFIPDHRCADSDNSNITMIFDRSGSSINISDGADENVGYGKLIIDPGAGNTTTLNGNLTYYGSANDLTISSGTLHLNNNSNINLGDDLINNSIITCGSNAYIQIEGSLSGSPAGGNNPACYGTTIPDSTPAAINWVNFSGTSTTQSISNISVSIKLQISIVNNVGNIGTPNVQARSDSTNWQNVTAGSPLTNSFIDSETLTFKITGTTGDKADITITNLSDASTIIDTVEATAP